MGRIPSSRTHNTNVPFIYLRSSGFFSATRRIIMLRKNSSPNCTWMVSGRIFPKDIRYHSLLMALVGVILKNCETAHSSRGEAAPDTNSVGMLHCSCDAGLVVRLSFSSPEKEISRWPKQPEGHLVREDNSLSVFCGPVSIFSAGH